MVAKLNNVNTIHHLLDKNRTHANYFQLIKNSGSFNRCLSYALGKKKDRSNMKKKKKMEEAGHREISAYIRSRC